jgi:hypothetical protein
MATAATFGEAIGLRMVYVIFGLITSGAGLLGLLVLQEPEQPLAPAPAPASLSADDGDDQ